MYNSWRTSSDLRNIGLQIIVTEIHLQNKAVITKVDSALHVPLLIAPLKLFNPEHLYTNRRLRCEETAFAIRTVGWYLKCRKTTEYIPVFMTPEEIINIEVI